MIVSGPKLPKTGGISTDDPADDSTGQFILVHVYIQLGGPPLLEEIHLCDIMDTVHFFTV